MGAKVHPFDDGLRWRRKDEKTVDEDEEDTPKTFSPSTVEKVSDLE